MSEMVERVARAMFDAAEKHLHETFPGRLAKSTWERDGSDPRQAYREMARAAIEAMREPSEGQAAVMRELLERSERPPTKRWHWIWQEMIDAALAGEAEGGEG